MRRIETLGKYEIVEEIGRGGFSVVYKALDTSLDNRPVALKMLHPHLLVDPTFVLRFRQEAGAAANLRHPNIVVIHEVGEIDGTYYIAMEYLPGTPLDELIKKEGPLALPRAAKIIKQIASALDYAHERGFIHRDVKSGNIIVREHDHASLTDFGLVRAAEGTMLTSTGRVMGTPEYMSPEQAQGREIDYRTDLYSLGVVAYEALTARVPFRGETPTATHYMHVHEEPPRPTLMNPDLTKEMEAPILKALAKDPQQRYQSGKELSDALERPVKDHKLEEGPQQPNRTRRAWIAGAALALIVLALACAVLVRGKGLPAALPPTETPTATHQPTATWTNTPTLSPTSTAAPTATATVTYTSTPIATPSPMVVPTSTATAAPTPVPPTPTPTMPPAPPGMIYVPAGDYQLSDGTTIDLQSYYIDAQPVTWSEYKRCVDSVGCSPVGWGGDDYRPMHSSTWFDADRYCRWAGKRLATLAERQSACATAERWGIGAPDGARWEWVSNHLADGDRRLLCKISDCSSVAEAYPQDKTVEVRYDQRVYRVGGFGFRCAADVD